VTKLKEKPFAILIVASVVGLSCQAPEVVSENLSAKLTSRRGSVLFVLPMRSTTVMLRNGRLDLTYAKALVKAGFEVDYCATEDILMDRANERAFWKGRSC